MPVVSGAVQRTVTPPSSGAWLTVTAAGGPGGSRTSVTPIVTATVASMVAVSSSLPSPSSPSLTCTITA